MNKPNFANLWKGVNLFVTEHSPKILMGLGIGGMVTTTVLAVRATPKALQCIEDAEEEKGDDLTKLEVVKACWKCYIPAAVTGGVSTMCLLGSSSVHTRRNAALAAAYKISETALTEYREKVVETIGDKKEQTIREKVNQYQLEKTPASKNEVFITGNGETLFLEPLSKRYFKSDIERVRKAENNLNKEILHDICGSVTLNDFYEQLGLDFTDIGEDLGWNVDRLIDLDITPGMTDDGKPCLVVGHRNAPVYFG